MIISAKKSDTSKLTEVAMSSKSYWGYAKPLVESWRSELTITAKMFEDWCIYKYVIDDEIAGFYVLNLQNSSTGFLEFLFVAPNFINKGIGKQLLHHAIALCKNKSCTVLNVLSDPNAASFYTKHGFKIIAERESSVAGRFLPEMEIEIPENG